MTDIFDKAAELEQWQREIALKNRPKNNAPSALYCQRCEEEIPEARRLAIQGVRLCVDCQQRHERRQREYRK